MDLCLYLMPPCPQNFYLELNDTSILCLLFEQTSPQPQNIMTHGFPNGTVLADLSMRAATLIRPQIPADLRLVSLQASGR